MRPWPWIALIALALAACGSEPPPPPPPAQPPKVSSRLKPPDPVDESVKRDDQQRDEALRGINAARTPDEAQLARAGYKGNRHAVGLDVALERKLQELDFAAFRAAETAVRSTATPTEAVEAARQYSGERYASDLDVALWDHMNGLVKKQPELASTLPPRRARQGAATAPAGSGLEDLRAALESATTENQAASTRAAYRGTQSAGEIEATLERWRFSSATWSQQPRPSLESTSLTFRLLSNGGHVDEGRDGTVSVVDATGKVRLVMGGPQDWVMSWSISPDEGYLVTTSATLKTTLWNLSLFQLEQEINIDKSDFCHGATLNHGATRMIMGQRGGSNFSVYDTSTGERQFRSDRVGRGLGELRFSPSDKLITGAIHGGAAIFDGETGRLLHTLGGAKSDNYVELSPDESTLAVASISLGRIWLYDATTGKAIRPLKFDLYGAEANNPSPSPIIRMAWLPSGRTLAFMDNRRGAAFYDTDTGERIAFHPLPDLHAIPYGLSSDGRKAIFTTYAKTKGRDFHLLGRPD